MEYEPNTMTPEDLDALNKKQGYVVVERGSKYELLKDAPGSEDPDVPDGFYRLRAVRDIKSAHCFVCAGDLGGFIANRSCLSQDNDAWVGNHASVSADSRVLDRATVCGRASVSHGSIVSGAARVGDNAKVMHFSQIGGRALIVHDALVSHSNISGFVEVTDEATVENCVLHSDFVSIGSKVVVRSLQLIGLEDKKLSSCVYNAPKYEWDDEKEYTGPLVEDSVDE